MHEVEAGILANIISEVPNATQTEGIRIVSGKDIDLKQYASLEPDWVLHHIDYILVENTKIQSNGNLFHIAGRKLNKRIIFYNSEIENIRISDSTCSAIYFVNSKCGNIDLTRDSEIGRLIFSDDTRGGDIALSGDKTRITELVAQRNASIGNIDLR